MSTISLQIHSVYIRGMLYRKWLLQLALSYDRPLNIKQYIIMLNYSVSREFGKSIMVLCFCSVMSETSTGNLQRLGMTCWLEACSLEGHLFTCQPEHLYSSCGYLGFLRAWQLCSKNICPKRIRQKLYHLSLEVAWLHFILHHKLPNSRIGSTEFHFPVGRGIKVTLWKCVRWERVSMIIGKYNLLWGTFHCSESEFLPFGWFIFLTSEDGT